MLVEIDDALGIHRPADDDPALGIEVQQALDAIALGFELEQNIGLLGEIRNQLRRPCRCNGSAPGYR